MIDELKVQHGVSSARAHLHDVLEQQIKLFAQAYCLRNYIEAGFTEGALENWDALVKAFHETLFSLDALGESLSPGDWHANETSVKAPSEPPASGVVEAKASKRGKAA